MNLDKLLEFSKSQALTASAVSTNVIPLGAAQQIGIGNSISLVVFIEVAADFTTGDETYQFILQTDSTDAFSSPTTLVTSAAILGSELTAGTKVVLTMPHTNEEYLRVSNVLAGTTPTATVSAYLAPTEDIGSNVLYANAYVVDVA